MKSRWLSRELVTSPICYALCVTEKGFTEEMKRLNIPKNRRPTFIKPDAGATAHFFVSEGQECAIVCIATNASRIQTYALLCHEAVHLWQHIKANIGEEEPSKEFEAYSIQRIAQELMYSYKRQTKGERAC